jgi:hypothetical protein
MTWIAICSKFTTVTVDGTERSFSIELFPFFDLLAAFLAYGKNFKSSPFNSLAGFVIPVTLIFKSISVLTNFDSWKLAADVLML